MFRKKRAVKYTYKITFVSASGVEDGSFVHIAWKRGSKSSNHGETEQKEAQNGSVDWNETITIPCTLFKSSGSPTGYDPKELILSLTAFDLDKKKDVVLGKLVVDLGTFADSKEPQTKYHNVKPGKKVSSGPFVLVVTYAPEVVGEGGEDEPMSETDAGGVSDEEEEATSPAAAAAPAEDPFAADSIAVATSVSPPSPKKTKSGKRSKRSGASTSALLVSPAAPSKSDEKLADVIRERDDLRQQVESLKSKSGKRRGSNASELNDVETLQQQLSALRSDKLALEQQLSETREELAVKTTAETRIKNESSDAQDQLSKLRATVKDGSALGDNAVLIKALEARIASLESERKLLHKEFDSQGERFRDENRALRTKISELEAAVDRAALPAKLRAKGEVEALQKQNTQLMKKWDALNELFDGVTNLSFTSSGKPMTSMFIVEFLRKGGDPDDAAVVGPMSSAIRMALHAPMKDFHMPLLWVSTLHYALQDLGASIATIPAPETIGHSEGKGAADVLTRLLVRAFMATLDEIYRVIEPACHVSFIASSSETHSTNAVINILSEVSSATKEVRLAPSIRKQLMSQIVYDIDCTVFNVLIGDKSLCKCDRVLKIRQAMSTVERWLQKDSDIASAKRQLQLVREVANLFMMDASVLADDEAMEAAFSVLNIRQIATLLELFEPDDLKHEAVDPATIRDLKVKALDAGDSAPLEAEGHRWFNAPKEEKKADKADKKKAEDDDDDDAEPKKDKKDSKDKKAK